MFDIQTISFKKCAEIKQLKTPRDFFEGFFGCIWLWQHGIRRVVALMGSSLSPVQATLVQKGRQSGRTHRGDAR
jgi:hypothetical protein